MAALADSRITGQEAPGRRGSEAVLEQDPQKLGRMCCFMLVTGDTAAGRTHHGRAVSLVLNEMCGAIRHSSLLVGLSDGEQEGSGVLHGLWITIKWRLEANGQQRIKEAAQRSFHGFTKQNYGKTSRFHSPIFQPKGPTPSPHSYRTARD